jgi:hypothetical protein
MTRKKSGFLSASSAEVCDDRSAEADGPAAISTGEENSLERMLGATAFRRPMLAAVTGVNDGPFSAHGPAFERVNKLHVKKIDVDR